MPATITANGVPSGLMAQVLSWVGWAAQRRLAQAGLMLEAIARHEATYVERSNYDLRKESLSLRFRAKSGEPLERILPEAYGLIREACRRTLGLRHYETQLVGGIALFHGAIAEMETGEGKTLTATLPMYIHSLVGKGTHLATVNDYLAERDADYSRAAFELLGVSVGTILSKMDQETRRKAYACDITYGTAKEFGFDFLRDRLLLRRLGQEFSGFLGDGSSHRFDADGDKPVQRGMHFCLVDEADSILIDEARTPLIIGALEDEAKERVTAAFRWGAEMAPKFKEKEHYEYEHDTKKAELTVSGRQYVRLLPFPEILRGMGWVDLYEYIERAIRVHRDYIRDRQYVVLNDEIVIVDENTGRLAEGRKWRDGVHQAVEAKEGIKVGVPTGQAARVTVQDLFLRYKHLAGMTGTASSSAKEFRKIYERTVVPIPTNKPSKRKRLPDIVMGHLQAKWDAIVDEIVEMHDKGRPVLVGTRSIDHSQFLSKLLDERQIVHQVLNAHEVAKEAAIVAEAGQRGKVTVATNMAGRGTDIKLGPGIADLGGLHVICTEMHDSARIDRQLIGRCGRQGDPGSTRQFMALDDEVIKTGFGPQTAARVAAVGKDQSGQFDSYVPMIRKAQRKIERTHFQDRTTLLHHEKERRKMQREMGQDPYLDTPD